jgi:hypothetical protein
LLPGRHESSGGVLQALMLRVRSCGAFQQPSSRVLGDSKSRLVPRGMLAVICFSVLVSCLSKTQPRSLL